MANGVQKSKLDRLRRCSQNMKNSKQANLLATLDLPEDIDDRNGVEFQTTSSQRKYSSSYLNFYNKIPNGVFLEWLSWIFA